MFRLPANTMMMTGDYTKPGAKVDTEIVRWCEETLVPGWEFGWAQFHGWTATIRTGPDGSTEEVPIMGRCFCIRLATEYDMVAFRLRWAEETVMLPQEQDDVQQAPASTEEA